LKRILLNPFSGLIFSFLTIFSDVYVDLHHFFGRCSGSNAYCSACRDCSACKNCAVNGGSCAVCYTPKVARKTIFKGSSPYTSSNRPIQKSIVILRKPKSTQRVKLNPVYGSQYQKSTTQSTLDSRDQPINGVEDAKVINTTLSEEQGYLNDSSSSYNYTVEIPAESDFVRVSASIANLRASASTKSQIKQKVKYGELLIMLETSGDWIKVQTLDSGFIGYIFKELVQ